VAHVWYLYSYPSRVSPIKKNHSLTMLHCFFRFEGKGIRRELLSSAIVAMKRCKTNKQSTNFVS
jgi:hypothetical protein